MFNTSSIEEILQAKSDKTPKNDPAKLRWKEFEKDSLQEMEFREYCDKNDFDWAEEKFMEYRETEI